MILLKLFQPMGADFVVYFEAAKMFLAGLNPYTGLLTRTFPFNYPPTSLLFLWPLGFFDYNAANVIWNVSSLFSVLVSVWLICQISHIRKIWFLPLALLFTLFFFPVKFNIGNGQINHFLLLFCSLAIYFYQAGYKKLSAFFLAFAVGVKFAPAVFLLYFVIRRDYRQIMWVLGMLLGLGWVSFLFIPATYQATYLFNVLPMSFTSAAKDWYYNQSLWGFLARSLNTQFAIQLSYYLLSCLILFLTWWRGRGLNFKRALSAVACLYLLIHPIALQHYFAFAIIPFILLGADAKGKDWVFLIVAYFLLAFDIKNFAAVPREFNFLLSHDLYGVLILWLLALWPNKFWDIIRILWIAITVVAYILMLLCHRNICF